LNLHVGPIKFQSYLQFISTSQSCKCCHVDCGSIMRFAGVSDSASCGMCVNVIADSSVCIYLYVTCAWYECSPETKWRWWRQLLALLEALQSLFVWKQQSSCSRYKVQLTHQSTIIAIVRL